MLAFIYGRPQNGKPHFYVLFQYLEIAHPFAKHDLIPCIHFIVMKADLLQLLFI